MKQDLDLRCEELIKEEFGESCNFDVDDAVHKLEKLGIVSRVSQLPIISPWLILREKKRKSNLKLTIFFFRKIL